MRIFFGTVMASFYEQNLQIAHIRFRGPVTIEISDRIKERIRIVLGSAFSDSRPCRAHDVTVVESATAPAASVGPSMPSVRRSPAPRSECRKLARRGESEFLVPSAPAAPVTRTVVSPDATMHNGRGASQLIATAASKNRVAASRLPQCRRIHGTTW